MMFVAQVFIRTPFYIWLLLAYLMWQGLQALRPRTQSLARTLVVPLLFIASGIMPLFLRAHLEVDIFAVWGSAALLLGPAGFLTGPRLIEVDRKAHTVTRPGSAVPLVRNLAVFVLQYAIAVVVAIHADEGRWLAAGSRAVSGATAGYFLGWALAVCRQYLAAPELGERLGHQDFEARSEARPTIASPSHPLSVRSSDSER